MRSVSVVRNLDQLGRIVIPITLRQNLGIDERDPMEIYVDGETIMLRKYQPGCTFCGSMDDVRAFRGKRICFDCLESARHQGG